MNQAESYEWIFERSDGIAPLQLDQLHELKALCLQLNLSEKSKAKLEETAIRLAHFQVARPSLKTPLNRIKELDDLTEHAKKICDILRTMDSTSHQDMRYAIDDAPPFWAGTLFGLDDGPTWTMDQWDLAAQQILESIVTGAGQVKDGIVKAGSKGGRPEVRTAYAQHIGNMALVVCVHDAIEPARGGAFERLCNAMFSAAGIYVKAEGAIKIFLGEHGRHTREAIAERRAKEIHPQE